MRKLFLTLLLSIVFVASVFAINIVNVEIMDSDFNNVTTTDNSTSTDILGYDRVGFYLTYDETEVALSISAVIKPQVSLDNSTWMDAYFYDYAGSTTLQASETISDDSSYYFWLGNNVVYPYVRINVVATNTDADDLLTVTVDLIAKE